VVKLRSFCAGHHGCVDDAEIHVRVFFSSSRRVALRPLRQRTISGVRAAFT